jgi:hypothetical protein
MENSPGTCFIFKVIQNKFIKKMKCMIAQKPKKSGFGPNQNLNFGFKKFVRDPGFWNLSFECPKYHGIEEIVQNHFSSPTNSFLKFFFLYSFFTHRQQK